MPLDHFCFRCDDLEKVIAEGNRRANLIEKPLLSEDFLEELQEILYTCLENKEKKYEFSYFDLGEIRKITGEACKVRGYFLYVNTEDGLKQILLDNLLKIEAGE